MPIFRRSSFQELWELDCAKSRLMFSQYICIAKYGLRNFTARHDEALSQEGVAMAQLKILKQVR